MMLQIGLIDTWKEHDLLAPGKEDVQKGLVFVLGLNNDRR